MEHPVLRTTRRGRRWMRVRAMNPPWACDRPVRAYFTRTKVGSAASWPEGGSNLHARPCLKGLMPTRLLRSSPARCSSPRLAVALTDQNRVLLLEARRTTVSPRCASGPGSRTRSPRRRRGGSFYVDNTGAAGEPKRYVITRIDVTDPTCTATRCPTDADQCDLGWNSSPRPSICV